MPNGEPSDYGHQEGMLRRSAAKPGEGNYPGRGAAEGIWMFDDGLPGGSMSERTPHKITPQIWLMPFIIRK